MTYDIAECVYHNGSRCEQSLHFFEEQKAFATARDETRCRRIENAGSVFDFCHECGDARLVCGLLRPAESLAGGLCTYTTHCDAGYDEFVERSRRWWEELRIEIGEPTLGLVEAADEKQTADFEIARETRI